MKSKIFFQLIILAFSFFCFDARAELISKDEAISWANDKGETIIQVFAEKDISTKYQKLDDLFINHVDLDYISKFVIGKYWRQMSDEQKFKYQDLFKRYSLSLYKSFPLDFNQEISFSINNTITKENQAFVTSMINIGKDQNLLVEFRLIKNDSQVKLIDIKIAEASMLLSYRNRFYQQIGELDNEIEWFLEDLETATISAEAQNLQKLNQK